MTYSLRIRADPTQFSDDRFGQAMRWDSPSLLLHWLAHQPHRFAPHGHGLKFMNNVLYAKIRTAIPHHTTSRTYAPSQSEPSADR